jgi:hypothetical protein
MKMVCATVKGFAHMRMFKKGQVKSWNYHRGLEGKLYLVKQTIWCLRPISNDLRSTTVSVNYFS